MDPTHLHSVSLSVLHSVAVPHKISLLGLPAGYEIRPSSSVDLTQPFIHLAQLWGLPQPLVSPAHPVWFCRLFSIILMCHMLCYSSCSHSVNAQMEHLSLLSQWEVSSPSSLHPWAFVYSSISVPWCYNHPFIFLPSLLDVLNFSRADALSYFEDNSKYQRDQDELGLLNS